MRATLAALVMLASPALAQQRHAALAEALADARAALCPRCADDIEREGINRPMLRMMAGEARVDRAIARLEQSDLPPGWKRMLRARLDEARAAIIILNEDTGSYALLRAQRLLRSAP